MIAAGRTRAHRREFHRGTHLGIHCGGSQRLVRTHQIRHRAGFRVLAERHRDQDAKHVGQPRRKQWPFNIIAQEGTRVIKGSCDYLNKPSEPQFSCNIFLRESGKESFSSSGAARITWCSQPNTDLHNNADCRTQQQQRGNGRGGGINNRNNNVNRRCHGGGFNTSLANIVVTAGTISPAVIAPLPPAPVNALPARVTVPAAPVFARATPTPHNAYEPPSRVWHSEPAKLHDGFGLGGTIALRRQPPHRRH